MGQKKDAARLQKLVDKYREVAQQQGVDVESVTIGEALEFLNSQR